MTKAEKEAYFRHLDNLMIQNDSYDTARSEGLAAGLAEGRAACLAEGRAEGLAEGEVNTRKNIALKMLREGIDISMITSFTGLSEVEIKSL